MKEKRSSKESSNKKKNENSIRFWNISKEKKIYKFFQSDKVLRQPWHYPGCSDTEYELGYTAKEWLKHSWSTS